MSQIRVLADHLANQIAAGEVVERPASVVKELLENSLDAGADRIDIQVEGGGTRLIRVNDNGLGMDADDVMLCLERHATSKLLDESQLSAIATLGFRGEALPSIGSVSRMTILSRTRDAAIGTRADLRYGILHSVHEDGCARGTTVEVRSLFGNLPARKKFLKTKRTELSHIEEVIRSQALAHPDISFSLQVEGRTSFSYSCAEPEQRLRDVFRYEDVLLPIHAATDTEDGLEVNGFFLLPETSGSRQLRILVNSRPVQDRMIRHAVLEGLRGFLMKGHQPAGALLLNISPELVDINVHPAKREIRFRKSNQVHDFMIMAVAQAVRLYQEQVRSELFTVPKAQDDEGEEQQQLFVQQREPVQGSLPGLESNPPVLTQSGFIPPVKPAIAPLVSSEPKTAPLAEVTPIHEPSAAPAESAPETAPETRVGNLTLIGQFLKLYLLCEHDGQLVVIDQHAAHERIIYQRLRRGYEERKIPCQGLMFPATVELDPDHAEIMEKEEQIVADLGVEAEYFGDSTWMVKGLPAQVSHLSPDEVLTDILDGLANRSGSGLSTVVPECIDNLLASMACKAAIKAGNRLRPEEMIELLQQMGSSDVFSHCPHGRPVIKTFSRREIEKWFHRT